MPDANITRAETAAFIYRLMLSGFANNKFENIFPDIDRGAWYAEAVNYLASIDIILGFPDGSFKPGNPITRAEFATVISKFDRLESGAGAAYNDTAGHWAAGYINSAAAKGWISGYNDGTFLPENYITRAEAVSSVNRMLHRMILAEDLPGWAPDFTDLPPGHWAYAAIIEASVDHEFDLKHPETNSFLELWRK